MTLAEIDNMKKEAEAQIKENYSVITGLDSKKVSVINDEFISFKASSLEDMANVLRNVTPYDNCLEIKHGSKQYNITSFYRLSIKNGYYNRELRIEFKDVNKRMFWVTFDFKDMDKDFIFNHFNEHRRGLYDTETVYVNIPSHDKAFKNIQLQCFDFQQKSLGWYGGDKTLIDEFAINNIIDEILSETLDLKIKIE